MYPPSPDDPIGSQPTDERAEPKARRVGMRVYYDCIPEDPQIDAAVRHIVEEQDALVSSDRMDLLPCTPTEFSNRPTVLEYPGSGNSVGPIRSADAAAKPLSHAKRRMNNRTVYLKGKGFTKKSREEAGRKFKAVKASITVPFEYSDLKQARKLNYEDRVYSHDELPSLGVNSIDWDGYDALPIRTRSGVLIALCAGRPSGSDWDHRMKLLSDAMDLARSQLAFSKDQLNHRRGAYPTISTGISYGGGATEPGELAFRSKRNTRAIAELRRSKPLSDLDGYTNKSLEIYAPNLSQFCKRTLTGLEIRHPHLQRPFWNSAFSTLSFNFGPAACTKPHKDHKNLAWAWCSVTSFGNYNYKLGGHLVLWDFKIAIQFPPHSTIFLPSAILEHCNTSIQPCETRSSITQYCSAGLFRWAAYESQSKNQAEEDGVRPEQWWSKPTHMFNLIT